MPPAAAPGCRRPASPQTNPSPLPLSICQHTAGATISWRDCATACGAGACCAASTAESECCCGNGRQARPVHALAAAPRRDTSGPPLRLQHQLTRRPPPAPALPLPLPPPLLQEGRHAGLLQAHVPRLVPPGLRPQVQLPAAGAPGWGKVAAAAAASFAAAGAAHPCCGCLWRRHQSLPPIRRVLPAPPCPYPPAWNLNRALHRTTCCRWSRTLWPAPNTSTTCPPPTASAGPRVRRRGRGAGGALCPIARAETAACLCAGVWPAQAAVCALCTEPAACDPPMRPQAAAARVAAAARAAAAPTARARAMAVGTAARAPMRTRRWLSRWAAQLLGLPGRPRQRGHTALVGWALPGQPASTCCLPYLPSSCASASPCCCPSLPALQDDAADAEPAPQGSRGVAATPSKPERSRPGSAAGAQAPGPEDLLKQ